MPLPGGSADKIGNRFELWWTARCLVDLLDERVQRISIEPPGDAGEAIEFILTRNGVQEHHQVKRQTTRGSGWTIATLVREGVMPHIASKLADNSDEFHFVSTMGAPEVDELSTNARQSSDFAAFRSDFLATASRSRQWTDLSAAWAQRHTEAQCYDIIKRVRIDTISEDLLRNTVQALIAALIVGSDRQAANELVIFALDSVNKALTPDMLWRQLRTAGFPRRNWVGDPHALKALEDNNERFLASHKREFFREPLFVTKTSTEVYEEVKSTTRKNLLITGEAGGGKSGLLVQVIGKLVEDNVAYLAMRLDRLDSTLRTTSQIGEKLDLPGAPVPVLGAIAEGRRSVLILDQLDAVSLISGKNPDLLDPVSDLLQEVTAFPEMRVIAVCRAFDLDNDHRLKRFASGEGFLRKLISPLSRADVLQGVSEAGFDPSSLTERQLVLFSNPLHLSMLAQIGPVSLERVQIETSVDLFDAFWNRKQLDAARLGVTPTQFQDAIDTFCQLLEAKGSLFVSDVMFSHDAANRLASEHVFTFGDHKWSFFHESFYDFANARRLYGLGFSVAAYLKQSGQGLELRSQLRQSLAFRRARDFPIYGDDIRELLCAPDIRFHFKVAAIAFLSGLGNPSKEEWAILQSLMEKGPETETGKALFKLIGLGPAWFKLAQDSGAISGWLRSQRPEIPDLLAWVFTQASRREPDGVLPLLKEAYSLGQPWKAHVVAVVARADLAASRPFFDFFVLLLGDGQFGFPGQRRGAVWGLLYDVAVKRPEWVCEVLRLLLQKSGEVAEARGLKNPFSDEVGVLGDDQSDNRMISDVYKAKPIAFLDEIWSSFVAIVSANLDTSTLPPFPDNIWRYHSSEYSFRLHEKILDGVEAGLRALAGADFTRFVGIVADGLMIRSATIDHLLLSGYSVAAITHPDEALHFLMSDAARLRIGWHDDRERPARELIKNASERCSDEALASLEASLLNHYTDWERTASGLIAFGYSQYRLLDSIAERRRSEPVAGRLREWERKFGTLSQREQKEDFNYPAGAVGPPIPQTASDLMTDDQWISAITKYSSSGFNVMPDGSVNSGYLGLAQELLGVAKKDTERFLRLMDRIPRNSNDAYFEAIIMAMSDEAVPLDRALAACKIGHELEGRPLGQTVCYCLERFASKKLPQEALAMIGEYSGPEYPEHVRSSAFSSMANCFIADRARIRGSLEDLKRSAQHVPREVRSHFCYALTPLFGTPFQKQIKDLFLPMWSTDPWLPADPLVEQFLGFSFQLEFQGFAAVMTYLLEKGYAEIRAIAARRAALAAMLVTDAQCAKHPQRPSTCFREPCGAGRAHQRRDVSFGRGGRIFYRNPASARRKHPTAPDKQ